MSDRISMYCVVSGRVQGVWFRAGTREQALALGLDGYARNLPDGRVEVVAQGAPDALAALREWLHQGTPRAHVTGVECMETDVIPDAGFHIR